MGTHDDQRDVPKGVMERLRNAPTKPNDLRRADFDGTNYTGGSGEDTILSHKAKQPLALRHGERYQAAIVAHESFTTNATAGDTETFNLSHDLIDSAVTSPDLVLYDDGTQVDPDSVNYSGDSFDYTDSGTGSTLDVYYVVATQAALTLKKVAPGGSNSERLAEHDTGRLNRREPNRDPLKFDLDASPLQPVVPRNWTLEWTIDGPFSVNFDQTPLNLLIRVPIRRATVSEIEGLGGAVAQDASQRV